MYLSLGLPFVGHTPVAEGDHLSSLDPLFADLYTVRTAAEQQRGDGEYATPAPVVQDAPLQLVAMRHEQRKEHERARVQRARGGGQEDVAIL